MTSAPNDPGSAGYAGPLTCLGIALSAAYAVIAIKPCAPGRTRLLRCLPVLAFFLLCPLPFHRVVVAGNLGFVLSWLASFKLLAVCQGRGPLAAPGLSNVQFACMLLLPLYTSKGYQRVRLGVGWFLRFVFKAALFAGLTLYFADPERRQALPAWLKHQAYAVYTYLFIGMTLDPLVPLLVPLLGLPLQPGMDQPFLSSSLSEFWGRRWNQVVSCTLQDVVYRPIVQLSWVQGKQPQQPPQPPPPPQPDTPKDARGTETPTAAPGRPKAAPSAFSLGRLSLRRRRLLAVCASFFVSGCMHELLNLYMCRRVSRQLRTLLFFVIQPPLILGQEALTSAVPPRLRSSRGFRVLQVVLTWSILSVTGGLLFLEHIEECGTDVKGFNEWAQLLHMLGSFVA